jgi:hypothetical protein
MYQIRGKHDRDQGNEDNANGNLFNKNYTDGDSTEESDITDVEVQGAVHVLGNVAERLRRLSLAYGEWDEFDGCAYFDLTTAQAERLLRVVERVATVHVTFYADVLLPSFQAAERVLLRQFGPEYRLLRYGLFNGAGPIIEMPSGYGAGQAQMVERWLRLLEVVRGVRAALHDDIRFWATNGAEDERARWRHAWMQTPAPGLDPRLTPALDEIPTLTLSIDFPLPAGRQPGRLRRLRRNRNTYWRHRRAGDLE